MKQIQELRSWIIDLPQRLNTLLDTDAKRERFAQTVYNACQDQPVIEWAIRYYSFIPLEQPSLADTLTEAQRQLAAFWILNYIASSLQNPQKSRDFYSLIDPDDDWTDVQRMGFVSKHYPLALIYRLDDAIASVKSAMEKKTAHRRGRSVVSEKTRSVKLLENLINGDLSDMPKERKADAWDWLATQIKFPYNNQNVTRHGVTLEKFLRKNKPEILRTVKTILNEYIGKK